MIKHPTRKPAARTPDVQAAFEQTLEQQAVEPQHVEAPATEAPATVTPEAPATAKKKATRYAPVDVLANPNAVLAFVAPQYHKDGTLTYRKYAILVEMQGRTIKEVEQAFVDRNWPRMKARNQMRWEQAHGKVGFELPAETKAAE